MFLRFSLLAVILAGCSDPSPDTSCQLPANVVMSIVGSDDNGQLVEVAAGGDVSLVLPLQGGRIILLAPRIADVGNCTIDVTAAVRDKTNNRIIGVEQRQLELVEGPDGSSAPASGGISSLANVAVCPSSAASGNIYDNLVQLELVVTDRDGRSEQVIVDAVPRCIDEYCEQDCTPF